MKLSTAEQSEASFATSGSLVSQRTNSGGLQGLASPTRGADIHTMSEVASPDFSRYNGARSSSTALATARMSARQVDPSEVDRLMSEHRRLAQQKILGVFSHRDEVRLEYVRWSLDRIEDAVSGAELDMLSAEVALYRQLGKDLQSLRESVDALNVRQRRSR